MLLTPRLRPSRRDGTGPKAIAAVGSSVMASLPGGGRNERRPDRGQVPGEARHASLVAVEHVLLPGAVAPRVAADLVLLVARHVELVLAVLVEVGEKRRVLEAGGVGGDTLLLPGGPGAPGPQQPETRLRSR